MKKQSRRQKNRFKIKVPRLVFTLDQLIFLRKALLPLEQMVLTSTSPDPNIDFALATVTQIQAKVNLMIKQGEWSMGVGFDTNEMLILRTAVWIFEVGIDCSEPSLENTKLKKQCETVNILLTPPPRQLYN